MQLLRIRMGFIVQLDNDKRWLDGYEDCANFYQHVHFPMRGNNTLHHVHSNIKHGYSTTPLPHLGQTDHIKLFLTSA